MDTLTKLTEREKLILEIELDVYERIRVKVQDVANGNINPDYYVIELDREIDRIEDKLKEPKKTPEKVDVITPEYGPGDEVSHRITDKAMLFKVMEVHHKSQEYKLTSTNQIKPVTVIIGWGELDETL